MRTTIFLIIVFCSTLVQAQSPCDNVKLYDQMMVKGDRPTFQKMKRFTVSSIPDSTLEEIKKEVVRVTSTQFYQQLRIRSVKLFDSAVARAWSWTNPPITDENDNLVYFFYAVVFETSLNNTPFAFRVDFLRNGELVNKQQLAFFNKGKLNIVGCKEIVNLVAQTITQPIRSIEEMYLSYSPIEQAIVWSIASSVDPKTGMKYFKDINAVTGQVIQQSSMDVNAPIRIEEVKVKSGNPFE